MKSTKHAAAANHNGSKREAYASRMNLLIKSHNKENDMLLNAMINLMLHIMKNGRKGKARL